MNKTLWTMALRNVLRRPRRSLLSMSAIGLAALTMTCLFALVSGLKADLGNNIRRYTTGEVLIEDRGMARGGAHALSLALPGAATLQASLAAVPGVRTVSPRIQGAASVFVDGDAVYFPFMGMDYATDPMRLAEFLAPGGALPVSGERQALVSAGLADKLGLKVGDTLTAVTQTLRGSSNGITFTVTGIVHPGLANYTVPWLFTSFETADRFVKLAGGATSLLVAADPSVDPVGLAATLQEVLVASGRNDIVSRPWNAASATSSLMDMAGVIYGLIGLLFAALASTVIINTMLMVVLERSKEVGMLAALGMAPRTIRNLFLAEGAVLAGAGALLGTLVGSLLSVVLGITGLDYTEAMKGVSLEMSGILRPVLTPEIPVFVFALSTAVALLFTLVPVGRLKNLEIVEALRGEI